MSDVHQSILMFLILLVTISYTNKYRVYNEILS